MSQNSLKPLRKPFNPTNLKTIPEEDMEPNDQLPTTIMMRENYSLVWTPENLPELLTNIADFPGYSTNLETWNFSLNTKAFPGNWSIGFAKRPGHPWTIRMKYCSYIRKYMGKFNVLLWMKHRNVYFIIGLKSPRHIHWCRERRTVDDPVLQEDGTTTLVRRRMLVNSYMYKLSWVVQDNFVKTIIENNDRFGGAYNDVVVRIKIAGYILASGENVDVQA